MSIEELLITYGDQYLLAILTTAKLTVLSFIGALIIGILITVMRISPIGILRLVGELYIQIFRNIPGAALLILLVYAFPHLNLIWPYFFCVLIATTLIPSAFCSEYLMTGMNTIRPGEIEAGRALGMSFAQIIRHIVMPQALRSSILPLTNLLTATMLTTSLASQVPLSPQELTGLVAHINTHAVGGISAFLVSAVLYCLTSILIGQAGSRLDRKVRLVR